VLDARLTCTVPVSWRTALEQARTLREDIVAATIEKHATFLPMQLCLEAALPLARKDFRSVAEGDGIMETDGPPHRGPWN
jgi:hypothetical protein